MTSLILLVLATVVSILIVLTLCVASRASEVADDMNGWYSDNGPPYPMARGSPAASTAKAIAIPMLVVLVGLFVIIMQQPH